MSFLELLPLTRELLPVAVELDQQCFGGLWTLEGYQRELDSPNSDLLVFRQSVKQSAILSGDQPTELSSVSSSQPLLALGCLWAILEEAHITIIAVRPDYQRQGLGQAMLWALLRSAYQRGLERATLEVRISNQSAIQLYQKFDFREAGRRRRYYQDTNEDALVLWRGGLHKPEFPQQLATWEQQLRNRLISSGWQLISTCF